MCQGTEVHVRTATLLVELYEVLGAVTAIVGLSKTDKRIDYKKVIPIRVTPRWLTAVLAGNLVESKVLRTLPEQYG